jgi:hypothetical protein
MDHERASKIVSATNRGAFVVMGISEEIPEWLGEVSLADMIEAKRVVEERDANQVPDENGCKSYSFKPDDRLIAAVYTLLHFEPANEAIVSDGRGRVLAVVDQSEVSRDEDDEEDAA